MCDFDHRIALDAQHEHAGAGEHLVKVDPFVEFEGVLGESRRHDAGERQSRLALEPRPFAFRLQLRQLDGPGLELVAADEPFLLQRLEVTDDAVG